MTRRNIIKIATLNTAASYKRILGANNRVRVGFIGLGSMGYNGNLANCAELKNTEISGICDVFRPHLERAREKARNHSSKLILTNDFRILLEDTGTDAICISTPDHWHALMITAALRAGKHVYCEKPIAHKVNELPMIIASQKKYGKVFTSGQWQRSGNQFIEAIEDIPMLGKIQKSKTWYRGQTGSMEKVADSNPPKGLDWNMWLGPAPQRQFNANRFLFNWRWFWDYGNGWFGDWGPHMIDVAEWGLSRVSSAQTQPYRISLSNELKISCTKDDRDTPTYFHVSYDYNNRPSVDFEYDGCDSTNKDREWGVLWSGENGSIFVDREEYKFTDPDGKTRKNVSSDGNALLNHWQNFIDHIINNKIDTNASLENVGTTTLNCLLAAAAHKRMKINGSQEIIWDPQKKENEINDMGAFLRYEYRKPWRLYV